MIWKARQFCMVLAEVSPNLDMHIDGTEHEI